MARLFAFFNFSSVLMYLPAFFTHSNITNTKYTARMERFKVFETNSRQIFRLTFVERKNDLVE